jgi:hypothetical protein
LWLWFGLLLLMFISLFVWMILTQPRCLRSHVEQRWVEYYCETVEIASVPVGDFSVPIYGPQCHDAHWAPITLCDEWQVERVP